MYRGWDKVPGAIQANTGSPNPLALSTRPPVSFESPHLLGVSSFCPPPPPARAPALLPAKKHEQFKSHRIRQTHIHPRNLLSAADQRSPIPPSQHDAYRHHASSAAIPQHHLGRAAAGNGTHAPNSSSFEVHWPPDHRRLHLQSQHRDGDRRGGEGRTNRDCCDPAPGRLGCVHWRGSDGRSDGGGDGGGDGSKVSGGGNRVRGG